MHHKLFYGWYIVIASLILSVYQGAIYMYGLGAFINPIIATFGWSMTQFSLASSLRSLETGVFNPLFGVIVDRYSPRTLMLIGTVVTVIGVAILGLTQNIAMFFAGFLIMGLGGSLIFGILPVTVIARWFRKDIGKANGVFYMGIGAGGVLVPFVVMLIDQFGWQATLLYSAAVLLIITVPLSFVYRSRPEDYGMLPDGKINDNGGGKAGVSLKYNFATSVNEALRTRAFWYLSVIAFFQHAILSVITLFLIPYLTNFGMERTTSSLIVSLFTFVSLFGRIPFGMLIDRYNKKKVIAVHLLLMGASMFIFWLIDFQSPFWLVILFGIVYGIGLSGAMVLRPPIIAEYFGTKNFGTIFGLNSIATTVAYVLAPTITGLVFDTYNSYKPVWISLAVLTMMSIFLILTLPPPKKSSS